jgi:lactate dehydrogenase-like 2-hydroxyacid dehydrogenase
LNYRVSPQTLFRKPKSLRIVMLTRFLQPSTHHMISAREFGLMKEGVVIVNTARGAIMDEEALVRALESGHVASAGLDVYEFEPSIHPGLVANPNVMLLPHMGTWTIEVSRWRRSNPHPSITLLCLGGSGGVCSVQGCRLGLS